MRLSTSIGMISLLALAVSTADAATLTGTVKGPDGQPFRGAFVQARNAKTKITLNVLSDNQGRYRVENLAAGDYRLQIRAPGYQADTVNTMALTQDQNATHDFALNDMMASQLAALMLPDGSFLPYTKDNRVRVLATSGETRSPFYPDVPTFAEQGFPKMTTSTWVGVSGPKGLAPEVVTRLYAELLKASGVDAVVSKPPASNTAAAIGINRLSNTLSKCPIEGTTPRRAPAIRVRAIRATSSRP